jgi:hypothetical protein
MRKSLALMVLSTACLFGVPAKAAIVVTDFGSTFPAPTFLAGSYVQTFDSSPAPSAGSVATFSDTTATFTATGVTSSKIVTGTSTNNYVAPLNDTTNYLSIFGGGKETITLNSGVTASGTFGLYIGSLDPYNSILFYDNGKLIASYTGAQIDAATLASGGTELKDNSSNTSSGYVVFSGLGDYTSVVLASSQNSFEVDDITINSSVSSVPPVPETSTWVMMILGFFGVGMIGYRRRGLSFRLV